MNVASQKLCEELFELSGWTNTDNGYFLLHDGTYRVHNFPKCKFPAYDAGFLLRKLPYKIGNGKWSIWLRLGKTINGYSACYMGSDLVPNHAHNADTPENVLCSLAIELFKQGVLSK